MASTVWVCAFCGRDLEKDEIEDGYCADCANSRSNTNYCSGAPIHQVLRGVLVGVPWRLALSPFRTSSRSSAPEPTSAVVLHAWQPAAPCPCVHRHAPGGDAVPSLTPVGPVVG